MPLGAQMAQAVHGAFLFAHEYANQTLAWHTHSQYLVVLTVENEVELIRLGLAATQQKIRTSHWYEPDMNDELTALVLEPTERASKLVSQLPLAGRVDKDLVAA